MIFSKILAVFRSIKEFFIYQRDKKFVENEYWQAFHKKINWKNPITYTEKLQVYKLTKEMENLWPYADKWEVRKIVEKKVGNEILNQVYGHWNNASKINFNKLPSRFILKTTHGSTWNVIVKDKTLIDEQEVRNKLNAWLKLNYYDWYGRERQYKLIKPGIICEEYLEDENEQLLDYKFCCIGGRVYFTQFDIDRHTNHKRNFYDRNWKRLPFTKGPFPGSKKKYSKPINYSNMVKIAENLAPI